MCPTLGFIPWRQPGIGTIVLMSVKGELEQSPASCSIIPRFSFWNPSLNFWDHADMHLRPKLTSTLRYSAVQFSIYMISINCVNMLLYAKTESSVKPNTTPELLIPMDALWFRIGTSFSQWMIVSCILFSLLLGWEIIDTVFSHFVLCLWSIRLIGMPPVVVTPVSSSHCYFQHTLRLITTSPQSPWVIPFTFS